MPTTTRLLPHNPKPWVRVGLTPVILSSFGSAGFLWFFCLVTCPVLEATGVILVSSLFAGLSFSSEDVALVTCPVMIVADCDVVLVLVEDVFKVGEELRVVTVIFA